MVDENEYFVVFCDVILFMWYCIRMLGFIRKGDGLESLCEFIFIEEGGKVKLWCICRYNVIYMVYLICFFCDYDGLVIMLFYLVLMRSKNVMIMVFKKSLLR